MKTFSVGFIGGGRITKIFLRGFLNKQVSFESVLIYEPDAGVFNKLKEDFPVITKSETADKVAKKELVFIAVHPPQVMEVLEEIKHAVSENTTVVSLAPKITLNKMASVLPTKKLVRMIPNATSYINKGFNPLSFYAEMKKDDKKPLMHVLKILGKTFETEECKLESYAIVSAMLPTYFWFQWYELERIAKETGLTKEEAKKAIKSTLKKAIDLYYDSNLKPRQVIDLIPVKPIGLDETQITDIFETRLMGLWGKIKP